MQATPLRAVMNAEEYQRARQRLEDTYGDLTSDDAAIAKRDHGLAELFFQSRWSQEQLATQEGKTQQWVAYRLRLGRFLAYSTNTTTVVIALTERRFRGLWDRTDKSESEPARFDAVLGMLQEPPEPKARSSKRQPLPLNPTPTIERVRGLIRPMVEAGKPISREKLSAKFGVTVTDIWYAHQLERGRLSGLQEAAEKAETASPIDASTLSKSAQEKFAALERRLRAEIDARVHLEVQQHINESLMPYYAERLAKADLLTKIGKPFTNAQFISLLRAVHPDSSSPEYRHAAFLLLKEKEVLLRPEEKDRPLSGGLPKTLAELLARKKAAKRK